MILLMKSMLPLLILLSTSKARHLRKDLLTWIFPIALFTFCYPESVSGLHLTTRDEFCTDECAKRGNDYFWCHTRESWDYCSPILNFDYGGKQCSANSPCEKRGEKYRWCYVEMGCDYTWGYCGLVEPKILKYRSRYGNLCVDDCSNYNGYFGCTTPEGNWEYCSPIPDVTYQMVSCREDHDCGLHGNSYYWCRTGYTSWDYCGRIEKSEYMEHRSTSGNLCMGECSNYNGYFACNTAEEKCEYCSPIPEVTYQMVPCRADHACGKYGSSYYWCQTEGSWGYCGEIEKCECEYDTDRFQGKLLVKKELTCIVRKDPHNKMEIFFRTSSGKLTLRQDLDKRVFYGLIAKWFNYLLRDEAGTLLLEDTKEKLKLRLDMQGIVYIDNVQHYNLQIQIGRESVAAVLVPVDQVNQGWITTRLIRYALIESFRENLIVRIEVKRKPLWSHSLLPWINKGKIKKII